MLVALGADHAGFELKESLKPVLEARGVAVGTGFRFGAGRSGDAGVMEAVAREAGGDLIVGLGGGSAARRRPRHVCAAVAVHRR